MTQSTDFGGTTELPISTEIKGYRFRFLSGEDKIGLWIDAEQESLGRTVTVKVLRPEFENNEIAQREFLAEMDRLTKLDHPVLLRVLDTIRTPPLALVTDRVAAHTLKDILEQDKPVEPRLAARAGHSLARGLKYLYDEGWAHKNLTPTLIQVRGDDTCRLVTFRNIIPFERLIALKGKLAQDANYVAPEQLAGEHEVGATTPCYQIACLIFHAVSGKPPHQGRTPMDVARAHLHKEFPSLKMRRAFLPDALYELIDAATVRDPEARPSLDEMAETLGAIGSGGRRKSGPAGPSKDAPVLKRRRRRRY